jgi:hypothetical protein
MSMARPRHASGLPGVPDEVELQRVSAGRKVVLPEILPGGGPDIPADNFYPGRPSVGAGNDPVALENLVNFRDAHRGQIVPKSLHDDDISGDG